MASLLERIGQANPCDYNRIELFIHFVLVGNKDDDPERKVVDRHDAQRFAEQMGIQLFETSAKENKNVEEVFSFSNTFHELTHHVKYQHYTGLSLM